MERPTRESLRLFLEYIFTESTDIDMLFIDFFQDERKFTSRGMSSHELLNVMLVHVSYERILDAIGKSASLSERANRYRYLLVAEACSTHCPESKSNNSAIPSLVNAEQFIDVHQAYRKLRKLSSEYLYKLGTELQIDSRDTNASPDLMAMEIALELERSRIIPQSMNSLSGLCESETALPIKMDSPFQLAGALSADAHCYMPRICDTQLGRMIASHSLVSICGPFQIGKTSLLLRIPLILGSSWLCIFIDIMSFSAHNTATFTKRFFGQISRQIHQSINDWSELAEFSHRQSLAILIDEVGSLNPKIAQDILPRLRWLAECSKDHIRIGCTMPQRTHTYFQSIHLLNPKDRNSWKVIEVGPCGIVQLEILISLLPSGVRSLTRVFAKEIINKSMGSPICLQFFCDNLLRVNREKLLTLAQIESIVHDRQSYGPN